MRPASALSALQVPIFRAVWIANTISNVGGVIQTVGASWMMTLIATSADMVALVQASVALPIVLLSLVAGAMADNLDRRKVMLGAQIFMLIVSMGVTICAWTGLITPWLLLLFTFLIGCGTAFNASAWQASVGDMVPRSQLAGAVALNSMGFNIARSVGPAIGGLIVAAANPATAFAVNAASYIALIIVLIRWRSPQEVRLLPGETLGIAIATGIRYVLLSPMIRTVLIRGAAFGFGASGVMALLPLVAKVLIAGGPLTYGLLFGAFGAGAVAGAMASARLRQRLPTESIVRWSIVAVGLAGAILGISTHLFVTMGVLLVAGATWVTVLSTFNVTVQLSAPRWVVARALSLYQMTTFGGLAAGSWLWGVVAENCSVTTALLAGAVVTLAGAMLGRWLPISEVEALNLDPLNAWREPTTAVPVDSRTGPVVITIEYRIREEQIPEFFAVMAERRRVRRRDGAHDWVLLRDLSDPQIWIERYKTATWLDYLRHNSRMTHDDAVILQRLRELHCAEGTPTVRRMIERQTGSPPAAETTPAPFTEALTDPSRST